MPLVDQPFDETFTFVRRTEAPYVDADGEEQSAPRHTPRFDHDPDGAPRGLLIEGYPMLDRPEICRVRAGDWSDPIHTTVLHEFEDQDGLIHRRAWYALPIDLTVIVNACMNTWAHQRRIAVLPGHLRNRGGFVRWRRTDYDLGALILADDNLGLTTAGDGHFVIEG